jgi:hypothetical protein
MVIEGVCDARFRGVCEEFERNFAALGEVGASVCVTIEGLRRPPAFVRSPFVRRTYAHKIMVAVAIAWTGSL